MINLKSFFNRNSNGVSADPNRSVYVCNVPYNYEWQDLKDLFRNEGNLFLSKFVIYLISIIIILMIVIYIRYVVMIYIN